jgi:hypothetical protein
MICKVFMDNEERPIIERILVLQADIEVDVSVLRSSNGVGGPDEPYDLDVRDVNIRSLVLMDDVTGREQVMYADGKRVSESFLGIPTDDIVEMIVDSTKVQNSLWEAAWTN